MFDKERYKKTALNILAPIKSADKNTYTSDNFLFKAKRSNAGRSLPRYYLIYFLFSELLEFKNLGRFDKTAWSFPISYKGKPFLIEYRKFGVGIFIDNVETDEEYAAEIAKKINGAVKAVRPFYENIASEAVQASKININNNSSSLFSRFKYLLKCYHKERNKYIKNKDNYKQKKRKTQNGTSTITKWKGRKFQQRSNWFAISCIEAFFSWTEHLFVHIAVVTGSVTGGVNVSNLIQAEWKDKYRAVFKDESEFFEDLFLVRRQLRNFVAHGAFGKNGNAFSFHSSTGAVPVIMSYNRKKNRFSLGGGLGFNEEEVITLIEKFIEFMENGNVRIAYEFIQGYGLPTILPYANDGIYQSAVSHEDAMAEFADSLIRMFDDAENMDW